MVEICALFIIVFWFTGINVVHESNTRRAINNGALPTYAGGGCGLTLGKAEEGGMGEKK
jgi:hypothetical protein